MDKVKKQQTIIATFSFRGITLNVYETKAKTPKGNDRLLFTFRQDDLETKEWNQEFALAYIKSVDVGFVKSNQHKKSKK